MRRIILGILLLLLPSLLFAAPVYLTSLQIKSIGKTSRLLFFLTEKTYGRVKFLSRPNRIVVELANTNKHFSLKNQHLSDVNITNIHTESTSSGERIIFFVKNKVTWNIRFLPGKNKKAVLLALNLVPINTEKPLIQKIITQKSKMIKTAPKVSSSKINNYSINADNAKAKLDNLLNELKKTPVIAEKTFTVVVDAGHGGKDSGAKGAEGEEEKDIVLAIAKILARKINQEKNMRAVLTRNSDQFLSLQKRLKLTRQTKADLFIAIHADAYFNQTAQGASVYALSQHGATSVAARWLAQRENHSELDGIELDELQDRSVMLRSVLIDLAQTATIRDSIQFGNKVLNTLDDITRLHYKRVEQAPFLVLKSPDIPSILVETGFVSNPGEAKRLTDPRYQEKVATALYRGIIQYARGYWARK